MNLKEFIEELNSISETWGEETIEIILSKDAEGNYYSPISNIIVGNYEPESTWSGHFAESEDFEIETNFNINSICLFPVN